MTGIDLSSSSRLYAGYRGALVMDPLSAQIRRDGAAPIVLPLTDVIATHLVINEEGAGWLQMVPFRDQRPPVSSASSADQYTVLFMPEQALLFAALALELEEAVTINRANGAPRPVNQGYGKPPKPGIFLVAEGNDGQAILDELTLSFRFRGLLTQTVKKQCSPRMWLRDKVIDIELQPPGRVRPGYIRVHTGPESGDRPKPDFDPDCITFQSKQQHQFEHMAEIFRSRWWSNNP